MPEWKLWNVVCERLGIPYRLNGDERGIRTANGRPLNIQWNQQIGADDVFIGGKPQKKPEVAKMILEFYSPRA